MASIDIDPESDMVTGSAGDNWYDHIQAWHDWIKNTSTKWDITDFTDDEAGSSGDKGFITTPTTGNLDFEVRLYAHSASSGVTVTASLDPGGNISSVVSATTKPGDSEWPSTASQDPHGIFNAISQRSSGSLISATDESLTIMTRDPSGSQPSFTPEIVHFGDIYTPIFANDPGDGLDGLGYLASTNTDPASANTGKHRYYDAAATDGFLSTFADKARHSSLFQTSSGEFGVFASVQDSDDLQDGGVSLGPDSPQPVTLRYAEGADVITKVSGFLKYSYVWDDPEVCFNKLETGGTRSFVFINEDGSETANILFPWDKTKNPIV